MERKKAALHNLGCKVNAYETEAMQQILEENGYEIVPFAPGADLYLINTCTVTNIADRKSRQMLHKARKMNPKAIVVAAGCYVQASAEELAAVEAASLDDESPPSEPAAPIDEPAHVEEAAPAEEPAPVKEPVPTEEPISNKLPTPEEAALIKPEEILPDESRFVNVMLPLVEEKLLKYVRMFHLCECPRCLADVKALALSHLPSKYVVLEGSTYTPMMSFYQAKFDSDVTAQVIHACKQVMEAPRHGKIPGLEKETH